SLTLLCSFSNKNLQSGCRNAKEKTDFLVDILYSVLFCCSEPLERKHILDNLTLLFVNCLPFLVPLCQACSDPIKHSLICDWLKGDVLGDRLISLASDLCISGITDKAEKSEAYCSDKWSLLSLVLSEHVKNETLIAEVYVEKIIDKLHCTLTKTKDFSEAGDLEQSVSFICDVASNFFSSVKDCLQMPSAEDLLLTMFQLCAQPSDKTRLSVETLMLKLQHTWMCGIESLLCRPHILPKGSKFLHCSAQWIMEQLQGSHLTMNSLQTLISAVDNLYGKLLDSGPSSSHFLAEHLSLMMPSDEKWQKMRQALPGQWSSKPLLEGRLSMNSETSGTDLKSLQKTWLPQHLCTGAIMSKMAFRILENNALRKDGEIAVCPVSEMLYSLQWCDELEGPPATLTECCNMLRAMDITHDSIVELGDHLPGLLELLYTRSLESGTLWSLTLHKHIQLSNPGQDALKVLASSTDSYFPVTQGSLHTIQCISPFLSKEEKELLLIQCISHLMSCVPTAVSCIDGGFGYLAIINSCLDSESPPSPDFLPGVLKIIFSWKNEHEELFLFSSSLQNVNPESIGLNVEIIRFISALLKYPSSTLPSLGDAEWDFIMCSMLAWLETACDSSALYHLPLVRLFACVSCSLASDLSGYFQAVTAGNAEKLPGNLISEWNEFFSEGIHSLLLPVLVKIAGESKATEMSYQSPVLQSLGEALRYISKEQLLDHKKLPAKFVAGQKTNLPDSLQSLLNTLAPLLLHRERAIQITVYHMLKKIMVDLPVFDEDLKSDEEEEPVLSPPVALMSVLAVQEDLVENLLRGIQVGEFAVIQPLKEEFCFVLGYLLTWKLILMFFKAASSQLRALYSQYLRKTKSLNKLLYNLFKLMPHTPVLPGQSSDAFCKDPKTFFTEELTLNVKDSSTLQWEIPHLACSVYHITLKDLPAMVRLWWNGCEKRIFSVVDKFTTKYVSGVLSSQEISSVQFSTQVFDGMTVKASRTTREVIATYSVDDICIELIIQLPPNYPLGSITVESGRG
ncbi:unnamed protein product, partial [Staurois parvus]